MMDPRGKFSDARRPDFRDLSHPAEKRWREIIARVDANFTAGARSKRDYLNELLDGGIPLVPAARFAEAHFDALFERDLIGIATREVHDTDYPATATEVSIESEIPVETNLKRDPLGIREEVSDAGDLETVLRAIEAQAKLLHRQSEDLKDVAERLRS